eukprot:651054-Amphidinium_carterae.2
MRRQPNCQLTRSPTLCKAENCGVERKVGSHERDNAQPNIAAVNTANKNASRERAHTVQQRTDTTFVQRCSGSATM